jgi:hypothetical protein
VGGPAVADPNCPQLPGFVEICRRDGLRLDFISWHRYNDDPDIHASHVEKFNKLLAVYGDKPPETLITEWNKWFDAVSVEELAYDPRRPALTAASILAMHEQKVSWTFYYHTHDQIAYEFEDIFKDPNIMYIHWNQSPHRFGLFGLENEPRPQYFVYQMLGRMFEQQVAAQSDCKDVRVLASRGEDACSVMLVNHGMPKSEDRVNTVQLTGLTPGRQKLTVYRIEGRNGWSAEKMKLVPVERREVVVNQTFSFSTFAPADSVSLVMLAPVPSKKHAKSGHKKTKSRR